MTELLDTHVHFWDPASRHHDWLAEVPELQRRFGPEDYEAGAQHVAGAVFVQADCRDEEGLDEVRWVAGLAAEHSFIKGIVAFAPIHLGSDAAPALEALREFPLVVGVRRLLQGRPAEEIVDKRLVDGVRLLSRYGFTFDVCATHDQLPAVAELVRSCPETSFVLDHLGKPPIIEGSLDPWRADISAISQHRNVTLKLSGLITAAPSRWTESDLRPYLEHCLEVFGPRRCMVGSDWPLVLLRTTAAHWFELVLDLVEGLSAAEQAAVARDTGFATYGLARAVPAAR
ncbi:MAG TPA: amidohydrolase family protein [Solirubrobacteraceae bacterium]|nr:amidohydrolase family protein [Solirubrobacteraceae bacterium]